MPTTNLYLTEESYIKLALRAKTQDKTVTELAQEIVEAALKKEES